MKSEIYKNFEFLQLDSSSKCHYYLKKENKKSIILTIGYADFWYHTEITNYLIENNFNIYIIDVCNMGTAQTEEINNQIPSIEFACQELDKYFDSLKIFETDNKIYWLSHSTSGLFAIRYYKIGKYGKNIEKYIFNAPLFDLYQANLLIDIVFFIYFVAGKFKPFKNINGNINSYKDSPSNIYAFLNKGEMIKSYKNYDLYKKNFKLPVNLGFISSVKKNTKLLQKGYIDQQDVNKFCVLISDKFSPTENYADNSLDVVEITKISENMGIKVFNIKDAIHDVFSSEEQIRNQAFDILKDLLK